MSIEESKPETGDRTLLVRLPAGLYWQVKAAAKGRTLTAIVRRLLEKWVKGGGK